MSIKNLKDQCNLPEKEELLLGQGEDENISKSKCDSEDVFSIGSTNLCPISTLAICDAKLTEWLSGPSIDMPGILAHLHHASPLESIRELVEMEEPCEHWRQQDGAARLKGQPASKEIIPTTIIRYMSVTQEGGGDAQEQTIFEEEVDSTTQPGDAHLENPMTDACSSVLDIDAGSMLQEDTEDFTINKQPQVEWCFSSVCNEQSKSTERKLTPSDAKTGVLEVQMDNHSSVIHLQNIQNPKEGHVYPQTAIKRKAKLNDKSELDSEPSLEEFHSQTSEKEDIANSVANQTLIDVLSACKAKVEHLERVKASSFDLSVKLQSAKVMAARLNQRVLCLEHECSRKEKVIQELTATLAKTNKALQARNSEMTTVTKELHHLQFEQAAKKKMANPARAVMVNGHTSPKSQKASLQNRSSSKVCTLF
ncbi:hypothetical protein P4O66_006291 [Electrophorus voltai]|uniref:Uncharacterized protein n=1 Tax=Electrophorus voltai TaxID=2609070 RepID=A0AAD8ZHY8_9TELE|nr:hypothetical protein P4O66_006291 [Electrophorus voltai]